MTDVLAFIILLALSAMFSAAETAFFSLRDSQVRLMERERAWNAQVIARLKKDPQRLLITILIGNNIVNLSIASFAAVVGIEYFGTIGAGIATGLTTVVILLWGEIFPKSFAWNARQRAAQLLAPPVALVFVVLYPFSILFVTLDRYLKRRFNMHAPNPVTEEEIRIMAELGLEHGAIGRDEREMIERIFQFDDIPVRDVMTHRAEITALDGAVPVTQIAHFIARSAFSRYPVYDGNEDHYIGYVHTNDVMRALNSDERECPVGELALPLARIDAGTKLHDAFRMMTRERSHLALVHKKGDMKRVIGLVTMEDLLESIVGDIEDEGDKRAADV